MLPEPVHGLDEVLAEAASEVLLQLGVDLVEVLLVVLPVLPGNVEGGAGPEQDLVLLGQPGENRLLILPPDDLHGGDDRPGGRRQKQMNPPPIRRIRLPPQESLLYQAFHRLGDVPLGQHTQLHDVGGGVFGWVVVQKADDGGLDKRQPVFLTDGFEHGFVQLDNPSDIGQEFRCSFYKNPSLGNGAD